MFFSLLLVVLFRGYIILVNSGFTSPLIHVFIDILKDIKTWLAVVILFIAMLVWHKYRHEIGEFIYKYRYILALVLFILCVAFEITGSSIGMWCSYFGEADEDIILGTSRAIRSDEWAVSTPMMFSQYYNSPEPFSYYSSTVRGSLTDVFLEYGQPVKDILMIFRPFYIGYLFLPVAKGMAFFWCGRWIALFLVSFEMGMLITKKDKRLSVVMAFLISFAPVIQWWFAVNGLVEMLIFLQLSILMLWKYMNTDSKKARIIYVGVIVLCAGGYILTFYPSWQVPLVYILLGMIIWTFMENYKSCKMDVLDWVIIVLAVIILACFMGYLLYRSGDTIQAILGTTYPGSRVETGGGMFQQLFNYVSNIWYAVTGNGTGANVCESSQFIDFFPISYIVPIIMMIKGKKKDKLTIVMLIMNTFLGVYCVIGFPVWLAKITLLSFSQSTRCVIAFEFGNIILLIRSLYLLKESTENTVKDIVKDIGIAIFAAGGTVFICYRINSAFFSTAMVIVTFLIFSVLFFGILQYFNKIARGWSILVIVVMLFSGLLVNPVRQGIDSVENISVLKSIREIKQEDPQALWVMENEGLPYINAGLLCGAATVNSTNVYPDIERWKSLDEQDQFGDIYNRYAHIKICIKQEGNPEFIIEGAQDSFTLYLTIDDLSKIGIDYIMTKRDLLFDDNSSDLDLIDQVKDYKIYKVYSE